MLILYVVLITVGCAVPVIYFLLDWFSYFKQIWKVTQALKQFPMEPYTWFGGHIYVHPGFGHDGLRTFATKWNAKFPRGFAFYFGPLRPSLVLNHPEPIQQIVKTTEPKNLGTDYGFLKPWIGDGLLLSSGDKWFRHRRLLTPGFHFEILKSYMDIYNLCVDKLLDKLDRQSAQTGQSLDVYNPVTLCTLDIILRCAFSTRRDIQGQGNEDPYANATQTITTMVVERFKKIHHHIDWIYYRSQAGKEFVKLCDYTHKFAQEVIRNRMAELKRNGPKVENIKCVDFLDILLLARDENDKGLTEAEIQDEVETFMFEGHDTTASGISFILYNLARLPEIQARARDEVDGLLSGRDSDRIQFEDLGEMPYLTRCIRESMRMHPPVIRISRQTTKPFPIDGKILPPGTLLAINIYMMHHNETVWKDPMTFDPDRFLPERMEKMHPYAFMPFSAGPRNCIGQAFAMNELKTTIARILHRFELETDASTEIRLKPEVVLRPESGIYVTFKKRD